MAERAAARAQFIALCRAPGVPDPVDFVASCIERGITMTGSAAQRPAWLAQAHAALDAAVAAAYGWPEDPATLSDDEILRRLLALNRERAAAPV